MPQVYPFRAIRYRTAPGKPDVSPLVAPPYDVLDASGKQRLLTPPAGSPNNIVAIDLPHTPAKRLGPASAYEAAAAGLARLQETAVLERLREPAMFAYRQTFSNEQRTGTIERCGMACCVETAPFGPRPGGGILPHEETFSGPKEDRLALMKATAAQLSPIFGLHADDRGAANALIRRVMASRSPDQTARTADGTLHEVWTITDGPTIAEYQEALSGEDVFIADGHHRYNTALNYLHHLESLRGQPLAPDHPARRCMMVLIGMSDPGLVIWPTHRVLGGMKDYSWDKFVAAASGHLLVTPVRGGPETLAGEMSATRVPPPPLPSNVFGLYDFASGRCAVATLAGPNPLAARFADKPPAWQQLDVAIVQHIVVEQICQPRLNGGAPVKWAFPHTIAEVQEIGRGAVTGAAGELASPGSAQLAVILRPTPLEAVRDVSRAGHLMPQKSTFFHPKLATGLFINPLA